MPPKTTENQAAHIMQAEFESVKQAILPIGVPLTSLLVYNQGCTYRKSIVASASSQNLTPPTNERGLQQSADATHHNGVPRVLLETNSTETDQLGGNTMFKIGSFAKLFLALIFCVVIENGVHDNLDWDTTIVDWITHLYGTSIPIFNSVSGAFGADLTIRDVLLHNGALPHMNWFLFLLDGTFQVSDHDFLIYLGYAASKSPGHHRSKGQYKYSNANYIIMALLLVKQEGRSLDEVFQKYLLGPLGMDHTSLGDDDADGPSRKPSIPFTNYAKGQRLSSDSSTSTSATIPQPYKDSTAYKITVGTWSCVNDIAKMLEAVFQAEPGRASHITPAISKSFLKCLDFKRKGEPPSAGISLAGRVLNLSEQDDEPESLNTLVREMASQGETRHRSPSFEFSLHESKLEGKPVLYCKGGTTDLYTATVYFHPATKTIAIALSNARGPVDVSATVARYLIRVAMAHEAGIDINNSRKAFVQNIKTQRELAAQVWSKIEFEDQDLKPWSRPTASHVGVYRSEDHNLQIKIAGNTAIYSRIHDSRTVVLTTMTMCASTSNSGGVGRFLRPFPQHGGTFVDRLTDYRDPRLAVYPIATGDTVLVSNPDAESTDAVQEKYFRRRI